MLFLSIIGVLLATFLTVMYWKKSSRLERIILILIGFSFVTLLLGFFDVSKWLFLIYSSLLSLSALLIVLRIFSKGREKYWHLTLIVALIWLVSSIATILGIPHHYEILAAKLVISLPLAVFLLISKKVSSFTKFWISLYLLNLLFEVYNSYWI